jgi:SRSO17 transposase
VSVIGHADRAGPLRDYCVGLMLPCERKSVEPMAAVTAPERTAAQHQSLLQFLRRLSVSVAPVLSSGTYSFPSLLPRNRFSISFSASRIIPISIRTKIWV